MIIVKCEGFRAIAAVVIEVEAAEVEIDGFWFILMY
jgi:hypothetical protein